jgi:hypothetical protein
VHARCSTKFMPRPTWVASCLGHVTGMATGQLVERIMIGVYVRLGQTKLTPPGLAP